MGAFTVRFKDLDRWNVSYFKAGRWKWPSDVIKRISQFTTPEVIPVSVKEAESKNIPIISKINFSGELFLRPSDDYHDYKGQLYLVRPGRMIFSKINAKHGCILFVTEKHGEFAVSGEYPVLRLNEKNADGEYVNLALRVSPAREQLQGSSAGMAKARTYLADFQSIEIPLPPLEVQRVIVARWQKAQDDAKDAEERVKQIESEGENRFYADLGLKALARTQKLKAFAAQWKDMERWSVSYSQSILTGADLTKGKFPVVELGGVLEMVQYGTSEKASEKNDGVPVIRMNNIVDGHLNLQNLKYMRLSENETQRLLLKERDILFNRTNSKELVGKCAVFHEQGEYVFASYLIRVRMDTKKAAPDFIAHIVNSSIGRQQINALSRQIIGQANVNSEELRSLQIPLPPLDIQNEIMAYIEQSRAAIGRQRAASAQARQQSQAEIEALILGTKSIV